MTNIQRYYTGIPSMDVDAPFVTYADHMEALRQAEQRHSENMLREFTNFFEQGQRDALAGAYERVKALTVLQPNVPMNGAVLAGLQMAMRAIKGDDT
jgi:hypothetical protein